MSVLWLLLILGGVVAVLTNMWRHGDIDLTGKDANLRGVHGRAIASGVALAALVRANLIDVLRTADGASLRIGWLHSPWSASASLSNQVFHGFEEVAGIVATGLVLAFVAKFWNDAFDVLYEFKRWLRGKANAVKPESVPVVRAGTLTRRTRSSRRRGGNGEGEGRGREGRDNRDNRDMRDGGPRDVRDPRDNRDPRDSRDPRGPRPPV